MKKGLIFTGAVAAMLTAGLVFVDAQGRGVGDRPLRGGQGRALAGPGQGVGRQAGPMFGRAGMGFDRGPMLRRGGFGPLAGLDLTESQQTQLRELLEGERAGGRESAKALGDARKALHDAIFAASPDTNAIAAAQSAVVAAETAALADHVQAQSAIAKILTPEQRAKLAERGDRAGRGPRGPRGGGFGGR
jgi:Spy/CpxP family protein refolding chaperone